MNLDLKIEMKELIKDLKSLKKTNPYLFMVKQPMLNRCLKILEEIKENEE